MFPSVNYICNERNGKLQRNFSKWLKEKYNVIVLRKGISHSPSIAWQVHKFGCSLGWRKLSLVNYCAMGAQENRGWKGYGRREVWTPLYLVCGSSNPLHYNVCHYVVAPFAHHEINLQLSACLHGGGGPQVGKVTSGGSPTYHVNVIKLKEEII